MKSHTPITESPTGPLVRIDGREYLYFVGTGYLGLQAHPEVIRAACEAAQRYGIHSATSRAGFGNTPPTLSVERRAAEFFGTEASFYFPAGYASNSILLRAIENDFDALFVDEYSHYCVCEAASQSGRPTFRFRHRDASDLADNLHKHLHPGQRPLVMTDGVFSVRGTIAPLADYVASLANYPGAGLLVDDAHGVGVLGNRGRGTLEHFGLFDGVHEDSVNSKIVSPLITQERGDCALFLCATLSKALGGYGGIIPGSQGFIDCVRAASHWYDGATSPPAPVTAASARALELIQADPDLRTRLWSNVRRLKDGLRAMGFDVDDTPVPIICLVVGDGENMRRIQQELMRHGIATAYIAAYSGLSAAGGLRIAVFAAHTDEMIQRLLDELGRLV
jgi:7-keto-8-aminopelargonate synthetase-like enzyme